jgi:hypothetical protein
LIALVHVQVAVKPISQTCCHPDANNKMKDKVMKTKNTLLTKISLCLGLAVALAFASGCSTTPGGGGGMQPMTSGEHQQMSK